MGWWRRQFVRGQQAVAVAILIGEQGQRGREKFGTVDLAIVIAILRIRHGAARREGRRTVGTGTALLPATRRRPTSATRTTTPLAGAALRRIHLTVRLRLMPQHALHRLYRDQSVIVLIHQAETTVHIGDHLFAGDATVAIGIGRPGAAFRRGWGLSQ